ncbi:hypothetical protein D3C71_1343720 [compost metagenome]
MVEERRCIEPLRAARQGSAACGGIERKDAGGSASLQRSSALAQGGLHSIPVLHSGQQAGRYRSGIDGPQAVGRNQYQAAAQAAVFQSCKSHRQSYQEEGVSSRSPAARITRA